MVHATNTNVFATYAKVRLGKISFFCEEPDHKSTDMKKPYPFSIFITVLFAALSFTADNNPLVGKWEYSSKQPGGPFKLLAIFRGNGTFDGFINKKEFVSGTYHIKQDTLYIADPTCNVQYEGIYKVEFFGRRDSLKFHVIQDTCKGRRGATDGFLFKNVSTAK
jgi:hypothetical protein